MNFRLSDEEFEKLRVSSELSGARSLSDFARGAVMRCVVETLSGHEAPAVAPATPAIDQKVIELEARVAEMLSLIENLKTTSHSAQPAAASGGER